MPPISDWKATFRVLFWADLHRGRLTECKVKGVQQQLGKPLLQYIDLSLSQENPVLSLKVAGERRRENIKGTPWSIRPFKDASMWKLSMPYSQPIGHRPQSAVQFSKRRHFRHFTIRHRMPVPRQGCYPFPLCRLTSPDCSGMLMQRNHFCNWDPRNFRLPLLCHWNDGLQSRWAASILCPSCQLLFN